MEGKVTISLDKLDYYRGLETSINSYKKNGVFKMDIQSDSYGSSIRTCYYASNESELNKSLTKESNKIGLVNSDLRKEVTWSRDRLKECKEEVSRLETSNQLLKEEKRPIDISRFEWCIIGCIIGMSVAGLITYIWS